MTAGFSGRGARRVASEARGVEDGREMSVMQLSPTQLGDGTGRLELAVERDAGVLSMVGLDTRGLGDDAQVSIADADLLQLSGKADIELSGVTTAVMDRAAQTVTVTAASDDAPVALFAGGGWDQVTLSGLTGRTRVDLGAGKDVIVSTGYSADEVLGGGGDDEIHSGRGRDMIRAGQGADVGHGEGGADRMFGGGGADELYGGAGRDEVRGGVDDDIISGGDDDDRLWGGSGDDEASGDAGDDRVFGGGGDDRMFGGSGDDYLDGQIGADELSGGDGDDELRGGGGADRIDGGADADVLRGGDGADTFVFTAGSGEDVVRDFEVGVDLIEAAALADWIAAQDAMSQTDDGVLLDFGNGDLALLQGIAMTDLDEASFLLG
jgi:Ca2+-binding RTX toxin-like protein